MKIFYTLLLVVSISSNAFSQSVSAEFKQEHQSHGINEIPLHEGTIQQSGDSFRFGGGNDPLVVTNPLSVSISENSKIVGTVQADGGVTGKVYDFHGNLLMDEELEFAELNDETIQLTTLNSGGFILRDNVANYSFFDASGNRGYTYSNSSGATGGEQPSGVAVSPEGGLVVTYNPVIRYGENQGSRASVIRGDRDAEELFSYQEQTIESVKVSENGAFIGVILRDGSGETRFHQFDRFGNELLDLTPGTDLNNFSMSEDGEFVTLVSGNRIQVYETATAERLGSATSRSAILEAAYFPEENLIISIGGRNQNNQVSSPEITAIDLEQRQIDRYQIDGEISFFNPDDIKITHSGSGAYQISGLNKTVSVTANF